MFDISDTGSQRVKCLEVFNFGQDFLRWVKTFYKNKQSCVLYLFTVLVETLAIVIRQNKDIKRITIGKEETKLLQYADDTTAVLSETKSAKVLFELLDLSRQILGLKNNLT